MQNILIYVDIPNLIFVCDILLKSKRVFMSRCVWVKKGEIIYENYHDNEWGVPLHEDKKLFELFSLETQAAGLSWLTILKKRDNYRALFEDFKIEKVAKFDEERVAQIMNEKGVIRNLPKLRAIVKNANLFLHIIDEFGSINDYFWAYVNFTPILNDVPCCKSAPTTSAISDAITKDLKKRGFSFVGSVTIYAFMQACGMVCDHENSCKFKTCQ